MGFKTPREEENLYNHSLGHSQVSIYLSVNETGEAASLANRRELNETGFLFVTLPTNLACLSQVASPPHSSLWIFLTSLCLSSFLILRVHLSDCLLAHHTSAFSLKMFWNLKNIQEVNAHVEWSSPVLYQQYGVAKLEIYLYQNVTSSYFNIDFDRLKDERSSTHTDRVTETKGQ